MPTSSQVSATYRDCPPWDICSSSPCKHSLFSTDEDYLADMEDELTDPELRRKVWSLFHQPENLSAEDSEKYSAKLARCQRLTVKRKQIRAEIRANKDKFMEECGLPPPKRVVLSTEECEALNKRVTEKIEDGLRRVKLDERRSHL